MSSNFKFGQHEISYDFLVFEVLEKPCLPWHTLSPDTRLRRAPVWCKVEP